MTRLIIPHWRQVRRAIRRPANAFGGFLVVSRAMVAKEAYTNPSVKDLIVTASLVDDVAWEGTYAKPTRGILTVRSELGEPIRKVATRGVKL